MSLDVYVQPEAKPPFIGSEYKYICSLDDDGYYWFLYGLFDKLAAQSGQRIDLYGAAYFQRGTLDALARTIADARTLVEAQPDTWEVVIGTRLGPPPEEIHSTVNKQQMRSLLDGIDAAASEAKATGACVTYYGD